MTKCLHLLIDSKFPFMNQEKYLPMERNKNQVLMLYQLSQKNYYWWKKEPKKEKKNVRL